jgi:hypothetical protein
MHVQLLMPSGEQIELFAMMSGMINIFVESSHSSKFILHPPQSDERARTHSHAPTPIFYDNLLQKLLWLLHVHGE